MNDWNGIKDNIRILGKKGRIIRSKGSFLFHLFSKKYIHIYGRRIVGWFKDSWGTHCSFIQRQKRISDPVDQKYDRKNDVVDIYSLRFDGKEKYFSSNKEARKYFRQNCSHYCNEEFSFKFSAIDISSYLIKFSLAKFHKNNYKQNKNSIVIICETCNEFI